MQEYNIFNFLEIIQTEGCMLLEIVPVGDEVVYWLLSRNGNHRVAVSATDETMTKDTAKNLCIRLELPDLIERLGI